MGNNRGFVGESESTAEKNYCFEGFLRFHMGVVRGVLSRKPSWILDTVYQYFDLYCGPGENKYGDGSPIAFLKEVDKHQSPFVAHFFDVNPNHIERLKKKIPSYQLPYCRFYVGDNLLTCRPLLKAMNTVNGRDKPVRFGLIYCDANGEPEWKILQYMSRVKWYKRTDILINVCANAIKRKRGANLIDHYLSDHLVQIDKASWSVRDPIGKNQWTMLLGMNWAKPFEWRQAGFYDIKSDHGREVLYKLNWSKSELSRLGMAQSYQPSLFDV